MTEREPFFLLMSDLCSWIFIFKHFFVRPTFGAIQVIYFINITTDNRSRLYLSVK